jgi:hypothetical protein
MTNAIQTLEPENVLPLDQQPTAVYLSSIAEGSRRTMREALNTIAAILTGGTADAL